jgi:uncharacterized membrane protein YeaQ/YmgE (transglycosylase-associated protein family)
MGLVTWIIVGAIAGWLAGLFMKGSGFGLIGNIVVGVIGALVGGSISGTLFGVPNAISGFNFTTILVALLGAVIVLFIVSLLKR